MGDKKIRRVGNAIIIFWCLIGFYFVELFEDRDLWEYFTLMIIGLRIFIDLKSNWRYLFVFVLVWNVLDEARIYLNDDFVDYTTIILFVLTILKMLYNIYKPLREIEYDKLFNT